MSSNSIAVVTGAGSGIGKSIALAFAAQGTTVIAADGSTTLYPAETTITGPGMRVAAPGRGGALNAPHRHRRAQTGVDSTARGGHWAPSLFGKRRSWKGGRVVKGSRL